MIRFLLILMSVLVLSCQDAVVRPDDAPAPDDPAVNQFRLELSGCGSDSQIGTAACLPGQNIYAVTEFPGNLTIASSNNGCSLNKQIRVSAGKTLIPRPETGSSVSSTADLLVGHEDSILRSMLNEGPDNRVVAQDTGGVICSVIIIYRPELPAKDQTQVIHTLLGQVSFQPDSTYKPLGNFAISTLETKTFKFTSAVRGAVASRQIPLTQFTGNTFRFRPKNTGVDLVQFRVWDQNDKSSNYIYTANYYSASARMLVPDIAKDQWGHVLMTYPDSVSAVSVAGAISSDLSVEVQSTFTGYIRAYTVQGRTSVSYFSKGVLQWTK